jgi:hypothetical protein
MQHLLVHLPSEAKVGGPTQFRWLYIQERELKKLRVTMHNKAMLEAYELLKQVFLTRQQCECSYDTVPNSRSSIERAVDSPMEG